MEEGTFVGWLKQPGERGRPGDGRFTLEGEKAAEEVESLDAGVLRIGPEGPRPGDKVKVGQVLAYLVAEGEDVPAPRGRQPVAAPVLQATPASTSTPAGEVRR